MAPVRESPADPKMDGLVDLMKNLALSQQAMVSAQQAFFNNSRLTAQYTAPSAPVASAPTAPAPARRYPATMIPTVASEIICYQCDEPGHYARTCPKMSELVAQGRCHCGDDGRWRWGTPSQPGATIAYRRGAGSKVDQIRKELNILVSAASAPSAVAFTPVEKATRATVESVDVLADSDEEVDDWVRDFEYEVLNVEVDDAKVVEVAAKALEKERKAGRGPSEPVLDAARRITKSQAKKDSALPAAKNQRPGKYTAPDVSGDGPVTIFDGGADDTDTEMGDSPPVMPGTQTTAERLAQDKAKEPTKPRQRNPYLGNMMKDHAANPPVPLIQKILDAPVPGVSVRDLIENCEAVRKAMFKPLKQEMANQLGKTLEKESGYKVTHNVNTTGAHIRDRPYSAQCPKMVIDLNGLAMPALLDSGAEVCLMSRKVADLAGIPFVPCDTISITDAGDNSTFICGVCEGASVSIGPVSVTVPFLVTEKSSHAVILGMPYWGATELESRTLKDHTVRITLTSRETGKQVTFAGATSDSIRNRVLGQLWPENFSGKLPQSLKAQ